MRFALAIVLVVANAIATLLTSQGFVGLAFLVGAMIGTGVLFPALVAGLFCIPKKHRNNKRFFRIFNVIALLVLLSTIPKVLDIHGRPPKILTGQQNLIEMTVPNSWRQGDQTSENLLFSLLDQLGTASLLVGTIEFDENADTVEQYADATAQRFKASPVFESMSGLQQCRIAGFDCVYREVEMSFGDSGTTMLLATLVSRRSTNLYSFIASTSTPLYEREKPQFLEILQSIKELG